MSPRFPAGTRLRVNANLESTPSTGGREWERVLACAACVLAPGAALGGTLDQQQTDFSVGTATIDSGESPAQTFTAGLSGGIDQVVLYLETSGTATAPLNVEIRDVSGACVAQKSLSG